MGAENIQKRPGSEAASAEWFDKRISWGGRILSLGKYVGCRLFGGLMKLTSWFPCCRLFDSYNRAADNMWNAASDHLEVATGEQYWAKDLTGSVTGMAAAPLENVNGVFESCARIKEMADKYGVPMALGCGAATVYDAVTDLMDPRKFQPSMGVSGLIPGPLIGIAQRNIPGLEPKTADFLRERRAVVRQSFYANTGRFPSDKEQYRLEMVYVSVCWFQGRNKRNPTPEEFEKLQAAPLFYLDNNRFATPEEARVAEKELQERMREDGIVSTGVQTSNLLARFRKDAQDITHGTGEQPRSPGAHNDYSVC